MRCPTCGRWVPEKQAICSSCGALVGTVPEAAGEGGPAFSSGESSQKQPSPPSPEFSYEAPVFESEEAPSEEIPPASELPTPAPQPPQPPPRRPAPSLIRILIVLAFFLAPLFNHLLRDSSSSRQPPRQPVLRQAGLCENVLQGVPHNFKSVFSLRLDPQIMVYSIWSGSRENPDLSVRWYTPQGTLYFRPTSEIRHEVVNGGFSAFSSLPLQPGMPLGQWKVQMLLDGKVRVAMNFQLQE